MQSEALAVLDVRLSNRPRVQGGVAHRAGADVQVLALRTEHGDFDGDVRQHPLVQRLEKTAFFAVLTDVVQKRDRYGRPSLCGWDATEPHIHVALALFGGHRAPERSTAIATQ